ncbi:MAG: hypothetical protein IJC51_02195 [Eggerthellaceae bacterium]|nr:hypothetical protein [Eggerthellaceae bacterium]
MASSSPIWFAVPQWYGIQQQVDGSLLPVYTAYDARNMETGDGNLSVAKGFTKHINATVPGSDLILKLVVARGSGGQMYVVTANNIYAYANGSWTSIYTFSPALTATQVDALQTRIGTADVVLICTGDSQIVKIDTASNTATLFGAGLYSYQGTVASYDPDSLTIGLGSAMSDEAIRRALAYGVTYNDIPADVHDIPDNTHIVLTAALQAPAVGDSLVIRGGGSDAHCAYAELYANRMFAAGDPSAPFRLYWSAVPGDGRTVEDWLGVDGSYDASGGYVEVGDGSADAIIGLTALSNQLIVWKRYSVWRLYGDRPSTFTLERVDKESDLMSNAGVVVKYDAPYLLMPNGIYSYNGVSVVPADDGTRQLRRFFDDAKPYVGNSRAAFCNNRFYMSCRAGATAVDYDDTIIVFDIARGSYMIRDGFEIADLTAIGTDIFLINRSRYVYKFETGTTYDGAPISAYWLTQPIDFGKKMYRHQAMAIYAHITGDEVHTTVFGDYLNHERSVTPFAIRAGYTTVRFQTDQSYFVQFEFRNVNGGAFTLHGGINVKVLSELKE